MSNVAGQQKTLAAKFLSALDSDAEVFHFVTLDDYQETLPDGAVKKRQLGSLRTDRLCSLDEAWPHLVDMQSRGAGVYVVINRTDGAQDETGRPLRRDENITGIRAVWHEDDSGGEPRAFPLSPDLIVESSPGKRHSYWFTEAAGLTREEAEAIGRRLVADHGSDPNAYGLPRVLRLPGTLHLKDPSRPHLVQPIGGFLASPRGLPMAYPSRDALLRAFPPIAGAPAAPKTERPADLIRAKQAIYLIPPDDRKVWVEIGQALYRGFGEDGRELWDDWSRGSGKYDEKDQEKNWRSFRIEREGGITLGTLFFHASQHGWKGGDAPVANLLPKINLPALPADRPLLKYPADINLDSALKRHANQLIKGVLGADETAVLYGASGVGKTFLTLEMAYAIARGVPWHGRPVKRGAVLYVALEGTGGFDLRAKAAETGYGEAGRWLAQLDHPVSLNADERGVAGLDIIAKAYKQLVADLGAERGLIVIDTVSQAIAGDDEDATEVMAAFVKHRLAALRELTGACVLAVHHANKAGLMRGNAALGNDTDVRLKAYADAEGNRILAAEKVRDGETGELFRYALDVLELGVDPDGDTVTSCVVGSPKQLPATAADDDTAFHDAALLSWVAWRASRPISLKALGREAAEAKIVPWSAGRIRNRILKLLNSAVPVVVGGERLRLDSNGSDGGCVLKEKAKTETVTLK